MATTRPAGLITTRAETASGRAWAVRLPVSAAAQLALLRTTPGIDLAIVGDSFWLHGASLSKELERQLLCLAGAERFEVLADQQLVPVDCLVPTEKLPAGPWIKIRDWLTMVRPTPAFVAKAPPRVALQFVRAAVETASTGLLTTLPVLLAYAESAPAMRLATCRFVATADQRVFVMGDPLPSLPGTQFYERERIWLPAGWTWEPALETKIVRQVLNLADGEHLLWESSDVCHRLLAQDFVQATRAAIRTTASKEVP
jgi:hypothetical protein